MNPLYVEFAQDVRGYALALLLVSVSCFFFVRGVGQDGPAPRLCWTAYTVVTALAVYCNIWAALVPIAQALRWPSFPPGGSRGAGCCRRRPRWSCCSFRWAC